MRNPDSQTRPISHTQTSMVIEGPFSITRETGNNIILIVTFSEACSIESVSEGRRRAAAPRIGAVSILPPGNRFTETILGLSAGMFFKMPWAQIESWISAETDLSPERLQIQSRLCVDDIHLTRSLLALAGRKSRLSDEGLHVMLDRLVRFHSNKTGVPPRTRASGGLTIAQLRRVIALIEDRLSIGPNLDEMANETKLSKFHFLRAFKATTGKTPHQFVLDRRLDEALAALLDRHADVEDIATRTGFSHGSHLSRMLKRRFGVAPNDFRRSVFPQVSCGASKRLVAE